ncbi:MAG: hypothetical protein KC561_21580, partial [Myxococcales bacterium]|nr:hypothetical protein [Myxococcales bacterium]
GMLFWSSDEDREFPWSSCVPRRAGLNFLGLSTEEVAARFDIEAAPEFAQELTQPFVADSFIEADFTGDGLADRIVSWVGPLAPGCYGPVFLLGMADGESNQPTLLQAVCEGGPSWTDGDGSPAMLFESTCYDLNSDQVPEIWLASGPETMRGYDYVMLRNGALESVGWGVYLGD